MELLTLENLIALITLTSLEVVLGIDNLVFLAILASKLPEEQRPRARRIGLGLAMIMRILLLLGIQWIMRLTTPLFYLPGHGLSGRDLILLLGGLFLLAKATHEIHESFQGDEREKALATGASRFGFVIAQIVAVDLVFSLDSVITAVGMARAVPVMVAAVIVAVLIMMWSAGPISGFVERHPTIRMLALAFLLLIGVMLVAESFHRHLERGYIYFAMAFSLFVEILNIRAGRARQARLRRRGATID